MVTIKEDTGLGGPLEEILKRLLKLREQEASLPGIQSPGIRDPN